MENNNNANQQVQEVQDINEIIAVRHGKLSDLKAQGKDPYEQVKYEVTAKAKDIFSSYADYEGKVCMIISKGALHIKARSF